MPALATLCTRNTLPIVFDADGLPADERVEFAALRPTGAVYRMLRDIEAQGVRRANTVITRSPAASEILIARAGPPVDPTKFHVVVNGRDPQLFDIGQDADRGAVRAELVVSSDAPLLVYSGSIGAQYRLDLIARLFQSVRSYRPDAHLLMLTGSPVLARSMLKDVGGDSKAVSVLQATPQEVPRYLAAADVGLAYRASSFSMQAVAPVKLAEYLLCGLPVVGTAKVGDTAAAQAAGVFLDDGEGGDQAARWVIDAILPNRTAMRAAAREVGLANFSLTRSVAQYRRAIESVHQPAMA
jgi:glycosyltransferase involved in cell wall biosynthesis